MKFDKGTSGNPNGRPRGSKNKTTEDLRQWVIGFISSKTKSIEQDWQTLEAKDRLIMFERLLKYSLPSLQAVSNTIDFEQLSDEQLDKVIEELKKTVNHESRTKNKGVTSRFKRRKMYT